MNKKLIATGLIVGSLAISGLSFASFDGGKMMPKMGSSGIQAAVVANNYASLPAKIQTKLSQAQFDQMVQKYNAQQAVKNAIVAGDYTAFKNALIAQMPDEATFQKMVASEQARANAQAQILNAVQNNDFVAYKTALANQRAALQALHPEITKVPKAPSDSRLQKNFSRLVSYYKTNGKLPTKLGGAAYGDDNESHPMFQVTQQN